MSGHPVLPDLGVRDVVGGWLVCLAVAAGCFALLAAAAPERGGPRAALLNPAAIATLAAAETHRADAHRPGRC